MLWRRWNLLDALAARHSTREYSDRELPLQLQSDLLWAASGINRPAMAAAPRHRPGTGARSRSTSLEPMGLISITRNRTTSEGLAYVVRGAVQRRELARVMQLGQRQRVILAQTVGYPRS